MGGRGLRPEVGGDGTLCGPLTFVVRCPDVGNWSLLAAPSYAVERKGLVQIGQLQGYRALAPQVLQLKRLADETSVASSQASVCVTSLNLVSKARSDFEQNQSALLDLSVSGRLVPAGFRAQVAWIGCARASKGS